MYTDTLALFWLLFIVGFILFTHRSLYKADPYRIILLRFLLLLLRVFLSLSFFSASYSLSHFLFLHEKIEGDKPASERKMPHFHIDDDVADINIMYGNTKPKKYYQ